MFKYEKSPNQDNMMPQNQQPQQQKKQDQSKKKRRKFSKNLIYLIIIIVLLAALGVVGYLYYREKQKVENPTQVATEEAERIKAKVSKLMVLPDEEPTIATIIDIDALKEENPDFYKDAVNGDKLLIYSMKAIIYSPSKNVIVNVAPVIKQPSEDGASTQVLSIELRNGSETEGVTSNYENQIKEKLGAKYSVIKKTNAANKSYSGVTVYDVTGGGKEALVNALKNEFSAKVETALPQGEATSNADVVVIIGN